MTEYKKLDRADTPLESAVQIDDLLLDVIRPFDYETDGTEKFYPFEVPKDLPKDYSIGVIVGASGTGKSTLLKEFAPAPRGTFYSLHTEIFLHKYLQCLLILSGRKN